MRTRRHRSLTAAQAITAHSLDVVGPVRHLLAAAALAVSLLASGCASGSDQSSPASATGSSALVGPDEFARRIDSPAVVTINVHIPDEGSIAGTDLTIAFDQITTSSELPKDRSTPLAVYCRSGNMSADAADDLNAMGYTDVVELDGGFNAWKSAGRPVQPAAS